MKKIHFILIIFAMVCLISLNNVSALGITPGRTTFNFEPGLSKEVSFSVINSDKKDMNVVIYVRGELKDYVKLKEKTAHFSAGEEMKSFTYTLNLPNKIDKPGLYKTEIVVLEVSKDSIIKTSDGQEVVVLEAPSISSSIAVITQIFVYVLHPGKYLEAELETVQEDSGKVKFIVPVTSKSKLGIGSVKATIDVYTSLNEKIATLGTNEISLESKERKEIFAEWDAKNVNPGKYRAVATVTYDGETAYADKAFDVGQRKLDIESITVDDFSLGEIAKFNILVNNNWNEEIKDVSVEIMVYNKEGETMADFRSADYSVPALSKAELVSYWDTVGVSKGDYTGKLVLRYGEQISERPIQVNVKVNDIEIVGFTGKAVFSTGKSAFSLQNLLIFSVILLIIINIIWFFLFLRKKKRQKSGAV